MEEVEIINKVDKSGLISFNLEDYYPKQERKSIDLKNYLWQGLILREKEFRILIADTNWSEYQDKFVCVYCSNEAIIPVWAYMLIAAALEPFAQKIVFGDLKNLEESIFHDTLKNLDLSGYKDQRIIIKGCSKYPVPPSAYLEITTILKPLAKSIMYGEACSTVPIYKRK